MILEKLSNKENPKKNIYRSILNIKIDKIAWQNWEDRGWGRREGGRRRGEKKEGIAEMKEGQRWEQEKNILIEEAIMGLERNLAQENFQEFTRITSAIP